VAGSTNALKHLKALAAIGPTAGAVLSPGKISKSGIPDCCICLFSVTIRQALFIAPCSHTFHYKCIRPLLEVHHPAFSCPLCRTFADLDEDVEVEAEADSKKDGDGADADDESVPEAPNSAGALVFSPSLTDGGPSSARPVTAVQAAPAVSYQGLAVERADPGAETEVEVDRDGRRSARDDVADLTEMSGVVSGGEEDEDMVDLTPTQQGVQVGGHASGLGGLRALSEEIESDADRDRQVVVVIGGSDEMGGLVGADGEVDADGTVGGKRKR